jgi:hypothetical protein
MGAVREACAHDLSRTEGQLDRNRGELHFVELCEACGGLLREIGCQPYRPDPILLTQSSSRLN